MQSIDVWLEVVCSSVLALGSVLVALSCSSCSFSLWSLNVYLFVANNRST